MLYLRTAIFTIVFILLGTFTYALWNFGSDFQIEQAREAYLKGDAPLARQNLALSQREEDPDLLLYLAYVGRDEGEVQEVAALLEQALAGASPHRNPSLVSEILLNQAVEAFSRHDLEELDHILVDVGRITPDHSQLAGFRGLLFYLKGEYQSALDLWSEWEEGAEGVSSWYPEGVKRAMGSHWKELYVARCQLLLGQVVEARHSLEELLEEVHDSEMEDTLFLLGFSHIQEGAARPVAARLPYFALSLSYFDRVPMGHPRFRVEKGLIEKQMIGTASDLFEQGSVGSLSSLVSQMGRWGLDSALQEVGRLVTERLKQLCLEERHNEAKEFAQLMIRLEGVCEQYNKTLVHLRQQIHRDLAEGNVEKAQTTWSVLQSTSSEPALIARTLADELERRIQEVVAGDNESLSRTTPYILFWEQVERDHAERLLFAKRLLVLAGAMWVDTHESAGPFELMKLAGSLPYLTEKQEFRANLQRTIGVIYQTLLQTERSESLAQLMEVVRYFHLEGIDFDDATEVANRLEDADYLYRKGELSEALQRIQVLLVFDADHQEAHRLAGLIQIEQGNPEVALVHLKRVWKLDSEGRVALGAAEVLAGDQEVGLALLGKVKGEAKLRHRLSGRLGYGLFAQENFAEAFNWLERALELDPSIQVGLAAAAFEMHQWDVALEHLEKIAPPYNQLIGVRVLAAAALGAQGKTDAALDSFAQLRTVTEPSIECSDYFAQFKRAYLDNLDPRVSEANLVYEQQPQRALEVLDRGKGLPPEGMVLKAKVLHALGRSRESGDLLDEVRSVAADPDLLCEVEQLSSRVQEEIE